MAEVRQILTELEKLRHLDAQLLAAVAVEAGNLLGKPDGMSLFMEVVAKANLAAQLAGAGKAKAAPKVARSTEAQRIINALRCNVPHLSANILGQ